MPAGKGNSRHRVLPPASARKSAPRAASRHAGLAVCAQSGMAEWWRYSTAAMLDKILARLAK
jgi:hypothetical protein